MKQNDLNCVISFQQFKFCWNAKENSRSSGNYLELSYSIIGQLTFCENLGEIWPILSEFEHHVAKSGKYTDI